MEHRPPRLALLLLRLLPADEREYVIGDLAEEYATRIRPSRSRLAADLWFWRQGVARRRHNAARLPWSGPNLLVRG